MHMCHKPAYRSVNEWLKDTQTLHSAYREMKNDVELEAEVRRLEFEYMKRHLINNVGDDEAERILYEHGFT